MGRPCKRPRFCGPGESIPFTAYDSSCTFDVRDEETSFLSSKKDGIEGDKMSVPDTDNELDQMRAKLDYKLKSKFEAIFEKYSRDFTGIGDEIDLHTGEILVDNGHLRRMEDERDAGTPNNSVIVSITEKREWRLGSNETEYEELDAMDHGSIAPEDMEEDDMIFFHGSRTAEVNPTVPPPQPSSDIFSQQQAGLNPISPQARHPYLSEPQIVARVGQRVGPCIARYVSQQLEQNDSNIELAWRTPDLPLPTPRKRPILKSILINPDVKRSPSPNEFSVWAPSMPPGRRRRDGADFAAVFKGETLFGEPKRDLSGPISTTVTRKTAERADPSQSRRSVGTPLKKKLKSTKTTVDIIPRSKAKSAWASTSYNQFAKRGSGESKYVSTADLCTQNPPTDDDQNDDGLGYFEDCVVDSAGPTECAPMTTSQTSNDHDNSAPTDFGSPQLRLYSAIITSKNPSSSVSRKPPSVPQEGLKMVLQSFKGSLCNVKLPRAVDLSTQTDLGPSYSFSDDGEDGNYTEVEPTNLETFHSDESPSHAKALRGEPSAHQGPAGYGRTFQTRVSEKQHTVEQINSCRETFVQLEVVEELLSVQKTPIRVEPLILAEIDNRRPLFDARVVEEPISASSDISRSHTPHKMELLQKQPCSPIEILQENPSDVVEICDQQVSRDLKGLGGLALSDQNGSSTQSAAGYMADRFLSAIRINDTKDQTPFEIGLPEEDSMAIQPTEKNTHCTSGETHTPEIQVSDSTPHQSLIVAKPALKKLPRPTRQSSMLPRKSLHQNEQLQLQGIMSPKDLGTPTPSHSKPYQQRLSIILGPDDFGELQRRPENPVDPALRVASCGRGKGKNKLITSIAIDKRKLNGTHTPKLVSPSTRRNPRSSGTRSANAGLASPVIGRQSGTTLQCGEKGLRCTKEFCFRCVGD